VRAPAAAPDLYLAFIADTQQIPGLAAWDGG